MKKFLGLVLLFLILNMPAFAENYTRTSFLLNKLNICSINIRNFNAKDTNGNEIIDNDEVSGNFINAIERLDELKAQNINAIHLLPITPVGKLKALGTAGSLYAISDFSSINPQMADKTSELSPKEQAKLFIEECHKRGISVIVDLPSCGSYDLFLNRPELFLKDRRRLSIVPTDWTDVRLFNTGTDKKLNMDLFDEHKKFVDMLQEIGADGIRADVAIIKPYKFWEELIEYAREKNPEFLFLAEASDSWREPPSKYAEYTPYDKLLEAGFDGYYGSFFNFKDWKSSKEFFEHIKFNKKLLSSYKEKKSVILSFATHDELSPVIVHGEDFSAMLCWLYGTLPFNPYFVDGFQLGDNYIYSWANKKAESSQTDDDIYFVHRGKIDIFNFSAKPKLKSKYINDNFAEAMQFRQDNLKLITKGEFSPLKTNDDKIFAYSISNKGEKIVVAGNMDYENYKKNVLIKIKGINNKTDLEIINGSNIYIKKRRNKLNMSLMPSEIKVLKIKEKAL